MTMPLLPLLPLRRPSLALTKMTMKLHRRI
jgi:hypothetical protein